GAGRARRSRRAGGGAGAHAGRLQPALRRHRARSVDVRRRACHSGPGGAGGLSRTGAPGGAAGSAGGAARAVTAPVPAGRSSLHTDPLTALPVPDSTTLRRALERYPAVVALQGVARLPELDDWYRDGLPALIAGRATPRLTLAELARLTEWKMARGVWRAPNLVLVRGNDPAAVEETSAAALARIPHPTAPIATLSGLAGVGPATASAAVAAAAPDSYPFFDEL